MTPSSKTLIYSLMLLSFSFIYSQNSSLKGIVIDGNTGQPIPGAKLLLKENKKVQITNQEGSFIFSNIAIGKYILEVSAISFQTKEITEIEVVADDILNLTISLDDKENVLGEVIVTSRAKLESVKSLLTMQKNSANVSDGISAETIKRTPDKNTSDVLKRISGASVQDNKFVIVRGLNDRYNTAYLNNSPLPSSEPDRKAFSFDIFPSNMLDNLVITKTATPDLPGEFAGGIIQINTKSVPDKNFQSLTIGSGYNTITTGKNQLTYKGSSTDWLGFDNGARKIPSTIPSTEVFNALTYQEKAVVAQSFESDFSLTNKTFTPNTSFQYSFGNRYEIGKKTVGFLFSVSHSITNNYNATNRYDWDNSQQSVSSELTADFLDKNYSQQVLTGAIGNASLKFNENHSINFKNLFSINSNDLVVDRYGRRDIPDPRVIIGNVRWFTSNKIYSGQLNGDHFFPTTKIKANWNAFYSNIDRSIPNLRRNIYSIADPTSSNPDDLIAYASIADNNGGADYGGGMFFSENKENISGGKVDFSRKINFSDDFLNEIKIGGLFQNRNRDFSSRQLQYNALSLGGSFDYTLLTLNDAEIFNIANMGVISPGVNGFTLYDASKYTDTYSAGSSLNAGYLMFDNRYNKFRLIWGVRAENFKQSLSTRLEVADYLNLKNEQTDILPSANLVFSVNKTQNLRLSYSKTVNRPEFRELAPFGFYDFTTQFFTNGNPDLKIAEIQNTDFRYEYYPGKGQLFTTSLFYKKFDNPIEIKQSINNKTISYENAKSATNFGLELEFRTMASTLFNIDNSTILDNLTLFSNLAIIRSKVDVSNLAASTDLEKSRPMQGQSPYVFNAGLQYIDKENGLTFSTNINKIGNRIAFASSEVKPAIWEKTRTFLDMQITKSLLKNKLELKLNIQNVLAQDLVFYQNNYRNTERHDAFNNLLNEIFTGNYNNEDGYSPKDDDIIWLTKFGRTFSLSMSYNF